MTVEVALSPTEIVQGAIVGVMRQCQNLRAKRRPAHGSGSAGDWQLHIEGALGEMALSKMLGVYYGGVGKIRAPDVGGENGVDVRTRSCHWHDLIIHHADPDDRIVWLLTGANGVYTAWGWIRALDGKRDEYWKDPAGGRPAFFVPKDKLSPPEVAT